jgi:hypothetical protein
MTAGDNPYFARAAANRLWGHFFGTGLVHPVDDFDANNPPSHPALLDDLARAFVEHEYNLKFLIRALTATRAYQLSSRQHTRPSTPVSPHVFAVMAVRSLSAEQLYDSLAQAVGIRPEADEMEPEFVRVLSPRAEFLEKFGGRNTEGGDQQTTILQALTLMNGQLLAGATNPHEGKTLQAVADFPLSTPERLEWLYLSTLSRPPRANETAKFVVYIDEQTKKAPAAHRALAYRQALADVFWVLLNSSEFFFNH